MLLLDLCSEIFLEMQSMIAHDLLISSTNILSLISRIYEECQQIDHLTQKALVAFMKFCETGEDTVLANFQPFWGRGQQYLCFERIHKVTEQI